MDGDSVYTLSQEGDLYCLDASSGRTRRHVNIAQAFGVQAPSWGFSGSPVVESGLLILNAGASGIAVDKKTGKRRGRAAPAPAGTRPPFCATAGAG